VTALFHVTLKTRWFTVQFRALLALDALRYAVFTHENTDSGANVGVTFA
jgi:hypothetical protein